MSYNHDTFSKSVHKEYLLKRWFDVVASAGGLLVLLPILLVIGVLVKLSSPGPVLFLQQRVGRQGRLFWVLKFRSMRNDAGGPSVTSGSDSRITPIGRVLRQWKLDELPQLWNVLRGDMSLVGPRPEVPKYVAFYTPDQQRVLEARPGITGISQLEFRDEEKLLQGCADVETFYIQEILPAKLKLDLDYVERRSLRLDVGILVRTLIRIIQ